MGTIRTRHSAEFKAKVALDALKGHRTSSELAGDYGVHPCQIAAWKKQLFDGAAGVFQTGPPAKNGDAELTARLYQQVGQLTMELDWVKKKAGQRL